MTESERLKTGTTTVGIKCNDAIILAADRRATAGHLIVDKKVDKVVPVTDNIAVTTAGGVSDLQLLLKYLKAELKLRKIRTSRASTVKESAHLLSSWVYSLLRSQMGVCHFVLGGYDKEPKLYDIYPDGSLTDVDEFVSSGSGSVIAYGVLEDSYKPGLSTDEGVTLCLKAIDAALKRDSASGNGVTVYVIDKAGVHRKIEKELKQSIQ
ncbi:proteasome subunit beta [Candidatus Woesearchaeota archaeon]|nr:proteasome subunit beta [Candidatus Woesearchaeota archaeon]